MKYEKLFEPILDNDEKIVEIFKPNFFRFAILSSIFIAIFLIPFFLVGIFVTLGGEDMLIPGIITLAFALFAALVTPLTNCIRYTKTAYCYTNKRVIIRTGFIGADFEAIDFDMIGGMNVKVDFLDKLVKPNTGTIIFASPASPMIQGGQNGGRTGYSFQHIENPYDVYKRVKEFSSKNKDGVFNS